MLFVLLDYVFPEFEYLERPFMMQPENFIKQNLIKCGAGVWGAKKI